MDSSEREPVEETRYTTPTTSVSGECYNFCISPPYNLPETSINLLKTYQNYVYTLQYTADICTWTTSVFGECYNPLQRTQNSTHYRTQQLLHTMRTPLHSLVHTQVHKLLAEKQRTRGHRLQLSWGQVGVFNLRPEIPSHITSLQMNTFLIPLCTCTYAHFTLHRRE